MMGWQKWLNVVLYLLLSSFGDGGLGLSVALVEYRHSYGPRRALA